VIRHTAQLDCTPPQNTIEERRHQYKDGLDARRFDDAPDICMEVVTSDDVQSCGGNSYDEKSIRATLCAAEKRAYRRPHDNAPCCWYSTIHLAPDIISSLFTAKTYSAALLAPLPSVPSSPPGTPDAHSLRHHLGRLPPPYSEGRRSSAHPSHS